MTPSLADLPAAEAIARLRRRALTSEALVAACLARIAAEDGAIGAFEHVDAERALAEARRVDALDPPPPLAGLPVGVKDIFDTADLPTAWGTEVFRGRRPAADALAVARLRAAGAVVLGKTVTTELAFFHPGRTRNPHDLARTPGGSSSGSAAAVAARLVPAALGTQTAGSVLRPASFCGVVGFKPTFGLVPMDGAAPQAPSLDTFGVFVRDLEAVPLLVGAAAARPLAAPAPARPPRLALCRTDQWPRAEPATRALLEEVAAALGRAGARVEELELGPDFAGLADAQRDLQALEGSRSFAGLVAAHGPRLSRTLHDLVETGRGVGAAREQEIRARAARGRAALPGIFARFDALLTPAAVGEAPLGLASTGDPAFDRIWTMLGTPAASLPLGRGPAGLPVGVQVVGAPGADAALVATCGWILAAVPPRRSCELRLASSARPATNRARAGDRQPRGGPEGDRPDARGCHPGCTAAGVLTADPVRSDAAPQRRRGLTRPCRRRSATSQDGGRRRTTTVHDDGRARESRAALGCDGSLEGGG